MTTGAVARDYSTTGAAWQEGPGRIYDALSERLLDEAEAAGALDPGGWVGRTVLDVGAGTGAASRAVARRGGRVVAVDVALGMLQAAQPRPPSAVADSRALPVAARSVDGYVAAFCLNHVPDPEAGLAEAGRVVRPGGPIVASAYAADDGHPVKDAVEAAAAERGWVAPPWAQAVRAGSPLGDLAGAVAAAERAGLPSPRVFRVEVRFPNLDADDLVRWRLGMAQMAPFVRTLAPAHRAGLHDRAVELLGAPPELVRPMVVIAARAA